MKGIRFANATEIRTVIYLADEIVLYSTYEDYSRSQRKFAVPNGEINACFLFRVNLLRIQTRHDL